jgi:hypothetical protein
VGRVVNSSASGRHDYAAFPEQAPALFCARFHGRSDLGPQTCELTKGGRTRVPWGAWPYRDALASPYRMCLESPPRRVIEALWIGCLYVIDYIIVSYESVLDDP